MFTYSFILTVLVTNVELKAPKEIKNLEEIQLWTRVPNGPGPQGPEDISSDGGYSNISRPRLIVHIPQNPIGVAMLVISGGGYLIVEVGKESAPAAKLLQSEGITAFELIYRLPNEGWSSIDVPFADGQRAMQLIRTLAKNLNFDSNNIGIMGFSAGGHLAGMIETRFDTNMYTPCSLDDRQSTRPNFAALLYPIISMLPPYNDTESEKNLLGEDPPTHLQLRYSVDRFVSPRTPATFLAQALDDPISNVTNSKLMYAALQRNNVTAELHLFKTGGHGWGLGEPGTEVHQWPKLFLKFLKNLLNKRGVKNN